MRKFGLSAALLVALLIAPQFVQPGFAYSCLGHPPGQTPAAAVAAAMNEATVVFAGRAVASDYETITFQIEKIWKGDEATELTVLTGNRRVIDNNGRTLVSGSSSSFGASVGTRYILYAYASANGLTSSNCTRTAPFQETEANLLDAVQAPKRISPDIRPCAGTSATPKEIRLAAATTGGKTLAGASATVQIEARRFAAITDALGLAVFRDMPPGDYRVTIDREGFLPQRLTIASPAQGCIEASIFLLSIPGH